MINLLSHWLRSYKLYQDLRKGNERAAQGRLEKIENSQFKLSVLQKQFRNKLQVDRSLAFYKREMATITRREKEVREKLDLLTEDNYLKPDSIFVDFIRKSCRITEHDQAMWQCTWIEERVFNDFEASLVAFIEEEFVKIAPEKLRKEIDLAFWDLGALKSGLAPGYSYKLSALVYLATYFLDNVYSSYLAWFLVYQVGLLPQKLQVLDIAAGPGTVAYGLALLLRSSSGFLSLPPLHISYYSLEKQSQLQYRGLQFWRKYIEPQPVATNAYFRFNTADIFEY